MVTKREWDELSIEYTLKMFRTGCEPINYEILQSLPTTTTELMKKLGLTKMPFYHRLNKLAEVGLIDYVKWTKRIEKSELTDTFFEKVKIIERHLGKNLGAYLLTKVR